MAEYGTEHLRVLLRSSAIQRRIREMGKQMSGDFRGERLHLIGVLKGASIFLADLIRQISVEVSMDTWLFRVTERTSKHPARFV